MRKSNRTSTCFFLRARCQIRQHIFSSLLLRSRVFLVAITCKFKCNQPFPPILFLLFSLPYHKIHSLFFSSFFFFFLFSFQVNSNEQKFKFLLLLLLTDHQYNYSLRRRSKKRFFEFLKITDK